MNEMLTWMESHPLPFACTTNFGEHLDPATLRRFVFKVRLEYLAPAQVEEAFRAWFALPPPDGVTNLAALTPGDFAVVHRKAWFLGKHGEPEALADMLRAECEAKPDRPRPDRIPAVGARGGGRGSAPWGFLSMPKPLSRGRWSAPPTRFSLPLTSTVGME